MSLEELTAALPPAHRKHLDPAAPLPARMMAAKGMVPLPPREMVIVACGLSVSGDEKVSLAAAQGLEKLPDKILGPVLDGELPPAALAVLCPALVGREPLLEKLVLNKATPDEAIAGIAADASAHIAEIIAGNQQRCMRSESLVRSLRGNQNVLRSSLDRLFDFLVRAGVVYDDMPEFAESLSRLSPAEMKEVAQEFDLPPEASGYLLDPPPPDPAAAAAAAASATVSTDPLGADDLGAGKPERVPMLKLVTGLNAAQKVALALKGNKEARAILLRDSNKVVASAVIRSPRITEQEIVSAAQSRSVSEDVIRIICVSKDMTRSYGVKLALVNNPKTPLPVAMRMLPLLRQSDLKALAKSKNVTSALSNQAKRLMRAKMSGNK